MQHLPLRHLKVVLPVRNTLDKYVKELPFFSEEGMRLHTLFEYTLFAWLTIQDSVPGISPQSPLDAISDILATDLLDEDRMVTLDTMFAYNRMKEVCNKMYTDIGPLFNRIGLNHENLRHHVVHSWLADDLVLDVILY